MSDVIDDLAAEHAVLDGLVAGLTEEQWLTPTPAEGWSIRDSVSHVYHYDGNALLALTDPPAFQAHVDELLSAGGIDAAHDTEAGARLGGAGLLAAWREARSRLLEGMRAADPAERVLWYGPAMSLKSFVTARLMETWAHGVDVSDALGIPPSASERLRNVCHISIGARAYSFFVRGVEDPGDPIRCELISPAGETWSWGPEGATSTVRGSALDLALLVTQRRHLDDTALKIEGDAAATWLSIAQSFAGPSGGGRQPLGAS